MKSMAYVTRDDVEEIVTKTVGDIVDKAVADLSEIIANFAQQVDDRFTNVEHRLDSLEAKYDHLVTTLDAFMARLDRAEQEQIARDNQFNRLLEWARKVSEKTGIPLENL